MSLTPASDEIIFEISQAKGGSINILTDADANPPKNIIEAVSGKKYSWKVITAVAAGVIIIGLAIVLIVIRRRRRKLV
jgi:hypothetical protein